MINYFHKSHHENQPIIIQGGMGVGVSNWKLARAVSLLGYLGVVSGTGINTVFIRKLQDGDQDGSIRRALESFPDQTLVNNILQTYFHPNGREPGEKYKLSPLPTISPSQQFLQLMVMGSYVEVFLAKESHKGLIGINFLEKLQTSNLPGIYGAMLAGVDYILMGAGIPREIPTVIDHFSRNENASIKVNIVCPPGISNDQKIEFDPNIVFPNVKIQKLKKPKFLAIISSSTLATHLAKKTSGTIDGFIVEASSAGGHNAPPRGVMKLNERGEPIYHPKDHADIAAIKALGLPFWLAGCFATPEKLKEAISLGASGIQVGTAFAFCEESGISNELKNSVLEKWGDLDSTSPELIFTDPYASPTDFPFKVAPLNGTLSDTHLYQQRNRICDLGYLRQIAMDENGKTIYRCPSEPLKDFLAKGGKIEETKDRKCLCNALMSNVGLGQTQNDQEQELPLLTAGDDIIHIGKFIKPGNHTYHASDVINFLLSDITT